MSTPVNLTDSPYRLVGASGPTLAAALHNAAAFLEQLEGALGEVPFVAALNFDLDETAEPQAAWQVKVAVYEDELGAAGLLPD